MDLLYTDSIESVKRPPCLRVVFTRTEVMRILANLDGNKLFGYQSLCSTFMQHGDAVDGRLAIANQRH